MGHSVVAVISSISLLVGKASDSPRPLATKKKQARKIHKAI
jgi:hypothetical protein